MSTAAIIVPCYKDALTYFEQISFNQLKKILVDYPIIFVTPQRFKNNYPKYLHDQEIIFFEDKYFESVSGYNALLTDHLFYSSFSNYEYILIYQLDAFVFSNNLNYFLSKKLSYIGAPFTFEITNFLDKETRKVLPIYHRQEKFKFFRKFFGKPYLVGNGGFSLRSVADCIDSLNKFSKKIERYKKKREVIYSKYGGNALHEDLFWSFFIPSINKDFKVANFSVALKFAFEVDPLLCYQMNKQELPFGCHAWDKHGVDFWRDIFVNLGYNI